MYDPTAYADMLIRCHRTFFEARENLRKWDVQANPDEVSLLFKDSGELDSFWNWAVKVGDLEAFDSVEKDAMVRQDREGAFDVRFEFLRLPGAEWRIEAMCVLEGEAPLHEQHLDILGNGCIFHVSYKIPNEREYVLAVNYLIASGLMFQAEYQNTYGVFSYFSHQDSLFYYKPRVNLRDL